MALAIAQAHGVAEPLARILAGRGVTLEDVPGFLKPTLREHLPDPSIFRDMDALADRLAYAVRAGEPVAVFGDYDVDGATSAALLIRFLRSVGHDARLYVPDRLAEGYGPNAAALRRLAGEGVRLVVTVDCGTLAHAALQAGREAGLDLLVVDHHQAAPDLPPALVVNPNRLDEGGRGRELAAVGVAFLVAIACNRALRRAGWYAMGRAEPDLMRLLDLVALGTVADVVPLVGLNRALVAQGLKVIATRSNAGIDALLQVARVEGAASGYTLGYVLGPRVNAGGRVGRADLGARLLLTEDRVEAAALALELDRLNRERQAIEQQVEQAALAQLLAAHGDAPPPVIVAAGQGWHPGVVGIVAGRLKERFGRPAFCLGLDGDLARGSGRSLAGVDLGAAVIAARGLGLVQEGGGHAMAAGVTLAADRVDDFGAFLGERLAPALARAADERALAIDSVLSARGATLDFAADLGRAGPWGAGHPEPRFALPALRLTAALPVAEKHLRCRFEGGCGTRLEAMAFRSRGTPLGAALEGGVGAVLHVVGTLRVDTWRGAERLAISLEDAAFASGV
ncbi:single-stranded-DNA-specific exonuclease RecJ [Zavarzinia sp. CC-PAN008]|uniref:single-stranded-DNA-specific exonuclease RecJ n=1 Tax=Zavarzinia sp. CC-PAN008 TaxID=3243332 RepID=UPI003F7481B0